MNHEKEMGYIADNLDTRALLEGLAEEAMEMGKAALKLVRAIYSENPTPMTAAEASTQLREEAGDTLAYMALLGLGVPDSLVCENPKWERWAKRVAEAHSTRMK